MRSELKVVCRGKSKSGRRLGIAKIIPYGEVSLDISTNLREHMGKVQLDTGTELTRKHGFVVIRQVGKELQFVNFIEQKEDAEDLAEDEAGVSNRALYVIPVTRFAREIVD